MSVSFELTSSEHIVLGGRPDRAPTPAGCAPGSRRGSPAIPDVIALLQLLGDLNCAPRGRLPASANLADQRKHDRAPLGDARFRGEIRILEHRYAYAVACAESLAGISLTLDRQRQQRDSASAANQREWRGS